MKLEPLRYVDALNDYYHKMGHPPYRWTENNDAPLHRLDKPLSECTVSMLVSGGVSKITSPPFNPIARNDHRLDAIERETPADGFQIHDAYYDHQDAEKDINVIFPLTRLREMEACGEIGKLADHIWSGFMGRIYNRSKVIAESGPHFIEGLKSDGVDVLLAVPT